MMDENLKLYLKILSLCLIFKSTHFRINKDLMNEFLIENEGVLIKLIEGETKIMFDQHLNIKGGFVFGITMVSVSNQMANVVTESKSMIKTMSVEINKLQKVPF
jgi:hypothetical protein